MGIQSFSRLWHSTHESAKAPTECSRRAAAVKDLSQRDSDRTTPLEPHQPAARSRQPSRRAMPSPPFRITQSWLHSNTGRATGVRRFIHGLVVETFHS